MSEYENIEQLEIAILQIKEEIKEKKEILNKYLEELQKLEIE